MSANFSKKRASATALLAALSLLLTGCFVTPGKFVSELVLNKDNSFSFTYKGEIFFLGLSQLAMMSEGEQQFFEQECYSDDDFEVRECTAEEIADQKAEWESGADQRAAKREKDAKEMAALLGGIDPTDPEAGQELARKLERQHGWNAVEYTDNGVFNVEYAITGQLSHDITFPVIEGVPVPSPFVQVVLRDGKQVRVNAPGFAALEGSPMTGMLGGMAAGNMAAMMSDEANSEDAGSDDSMSELVKMEGVFTIVTNGQILANNTDEGPVISPTGQVLTWKVDNGTKTAPTALIGLNQ